MTRVVISHQNKLDYWAENIRQTILKWKNNFIGSNSSVVKIGILSNKRAIILGIIIFFSFKFIMQQSAENGFEQCEGLNKKVANQTLGELNEPLLKSIRIQNSRGR